MTEPLPAIVSILASATLATIITWAIMHNKIVNYRVFLRKRRLLTEFEEFAVKRSRLQQDMNDGRE